MKFSHQGRIASITMLVVVTKLSLVYSEEQQNTLHTEDILKYLQGKEINPLAVSVSPRMLQYQQYCNSTSCSECLNMIGDNGWNCGWCSNRNGYCWSYTYGLCDYATTCSSNDGTTSSNDGTTTSATINSNNCTGSYDYDVGEFDCADSSQAQRAYMEFQSNKYGACKHESRVAFVWVPCLFFFFIYILRLRYIYVNYPEMYEDFDLYSHLLDNLKNGLGANKNKNKNVV